ncbi:MAG: cytochrome C [Proteobacteria bacterium]|nr:cytochrome C [Pseudomonadota bacterium]
MYDSGKIITGLVIAIVILTFPFWWNMGSAMPPAPDPKLADKAKAAGQCIYSKAYMKTSHMQVLDDWRNMVVRDGVRYTLLQPGGDPIEMQVIKEGRSRLMAATNHLQLGAKGSQYEMSLQNTCMDCHSSKKEFCDQCHNYASVSPFCWDCHVEPEEKK